MERIVHEDEQYKNIVSIGDDIKPMYIISNYGDVINIKTNKRIIPHMNENGYLQVSLMCQNKRIFRKVHRLVMMTFSYIEGCEKLQVNHKNGIKTDNSYFNLEWATPKENVSHAISNDLRSSFIGEANPKAILNESEVRTIVDMVLNGVPDKEIINSICNGNASIFRDIIYRNTWSHIISDEEMYKISLTRKGNIISIEDRHNICRFYENNNTLYSGYGSISNMARDAIISINKDPNNMSIFRIAKRLYYRYESPEITKNYKY